MGKRKPNIKGSIYPIREAENSKDSDTTVQSLRTGVDNIDVADCGQHPQLNDIDRINCLRPRTPQPPESSINSAGTDSSITLLPRPQLENNAKPTVLASIRPRKVFVKGKSYKKDMAILSIAYTLQENPELERLIRLLVEIRDKDSEGQLTAVLETCTQFGVQLASATDVHHAEATLAIAAFIETVARLNTIQLDGDVKFLDELTGMINKDIDRIKPSFIGNANIETEEGLARFKQRGTSDDLDETIPLHREVLLLCPAPHPDHCGSLNNLANALHTRFEQRGDLVDLDEAISLHREAIYLLPVPHPDRSMSLNNLASALHTHFQHQGASVDLDEAISLHRQAIYLLPVPHPDRSMSLNNLASALHTRFEQRGDPVDLDEAISLHRESLLLFPALHPDHFASLNDFASVFQTRFEQRGAADNPDEAISSHREALHLRPAPHPDRSSLLNNLATVLQQPGHEPTLHITSRPSNIPQPSEENITETTTCWIAAEHALQHAQAKHLSIAETFNTYKIAVSEYHVQAGFDEELIKSGIGYLEQIHVFLDAEVDADSLLLSKLGVLFSPFSSILFTNSCSYHLPVFKEDGSIWQFEELVYFNAGKFADGGRTAKSPLTVISYSQTAGSSVGITGLSQGSGGEEGQNIKDRRPGKGKRRDRGEKSEDDGEASNDRDPPGDPEDPSKGQSRNTAVPQNISFEIASDIYLSHDMLNPFQTLNMEGELAIETTPLVLSPPRFSEHRVHFTSVYFNTKPLTNIAYKQFHVGVAIDSNQKNASVKDVHPKTTTYSDGEEKLTSSSKIGRSRGVTAGLTLGPHPQGALTGTVTQTNEENVGLELKRYRSDIEEHHSKGSVWWGFNIEDQNVQKVGIDMPQNILPNARFLFFGNSNVPAPPPRHMDIVVSSYWSMISPQEPRGTWIRRLFEIFKAPGKNQDTPQHSNLFNVVVLRADLDPSIGSELSHYIAEVDVRSGTSQHPRVQRPAADSVDMASITVDDLGKMRTFDIPTIANVILSPHCVPIFDKSGHDIKSH